MVIKIWGRTHAHGRQIEAGDPKNQYPIQPPNAMRLQSQSQGTHEPPHHERIWLEHRIIVSEAELLVRVFMVRYVEIGSYH